MVISMGGAGSRSKEIVVMIAAGNEVFDWCFTTKGVYRHVTLQAELKEKGQLAEIARLV